MKNWTQLFKKQDGIITVEMAFVITAFVVLLAIIVDFGIVLLKQSNLERTNASLASIFREREALYRQDNTLTKFEAEEISQEHTDQIGRLAVTLLNEPDLNIRVDAVYFAGTITKTIQSTSTYYFGNDTSCTQNIAPLSDFQHLSPYSGLNRWMPLYRITTCLPGSKSWYKNIINNDPDENISDKFIVSNITIPR